MSALTYGVQFVGHSPLSKDNHNFGIFRHRHNHQHIDVHSALLLYCTQNIWKKFNKQLIWHNVFHIHNQNFTCHIALHQVPDKIQLLVHTRIWKVNKCLIVIIHIQIFSPWNQIILVVFFIIKLERPAWSLGRSTSKTSTVLIIKDWTTRSFSRSWPTTSLASWTVSVFIIKDGPAWPLM